MNHGRKDSGLDVADHREAQLVRLLRTRMVLCHQLATAQRSRDEALSAPRTARLAGRLRSLEVQIASTIDPGVVPITARENFFSPTLVFASSRP